MRTNRIRSLRTAAAPLLAALLIASPAHSHRYAAAAAATDSLPLWEVTDGENRLYLMGSIHLLRPDVYPLDPALYEAFDAAAVVAFELDFGEMMAAAPMMMARGMYDEGSSLRDVLPPDLMSELERRLEALPLTIEVVERMKPWLAALSLSSLVLQQAGFDAAAGVDMHLYERARAAEMRITSLETMEQQIDVFDTLGDSAQVAFMRSTLDELDASAERLDAATALWQRGDGPALAAMFTESMEGQPELMERLVHARNRAWIPAIEALLQSGETAMVVVGMGHLVGEDSVVELLRARGYTVVAHAPALR